MAFSLARAFNTAAVRDTVGKHVYTDAHLSYIACGNAPSPFAVPLTSPQEIDKAARILFQLAACNTPPEDLKALLPKKDRSKAAPSAEELMSDAPLEFKPVAPE